MGNNHQSTKTNEPNIELLFDAQDKKQIKVMADCPYCRGKNFVKSGVRQKRYSQVQVYYCKDCDKKFTLGPTRHKSFPLRVILDSITYYNRFHTLDETSVHLSQKYGYKINKQSILNWIEHFKASCPFVRLRPFIAQKYNKKDIFVESRMFHGQIYDFKYHRAKTDCIISEDFSHFKFKPLQEFLELVSAECPHQIFKENKTRASEYKDIFNLDQVKITPIENTATKNTRLIMQAVANNKLRHEILQEFMLVNDSVTIATEIPIILDPDDVLHYRNMLNFEVPIELKDEEFITGHIDLVQIRNGMIHIMDFKPSAHKVKPIEQLTIYALALSRLTSLRLFHFKCAWFDGDDYFEFYPLHVVYKTKKIKS